LHLGGLVLLARVATHFGRLGHDGRALGQDTFDLSFGDVFFRLVNLKLESVKLEVFWDKGDVEVSGPYGL